jgi:acetyl-CoA C-acetyltransferase/acetyl-CoA acyltransferase
MRDVAIIGIGHTKFGRSSKTNLELFSEAALQAMDDAGVVGKDIEALFQGAVFPAFEEGQGMISVFSAADLNLGPIPTTTFESACASASVAIRDAYMWVGSGEYEMVLTGGTERGLLMGTSFATRAFAMGCHASSEGPAGLTFPGVFAMAARLYSKNYDIPLENVREKMARVSIKNHKHGALNPLAQFYKKYGTLKVEDVINSRMVCDPLTFLDCCPFSDGAAALVLCSADRARKYTDEPVYILGTGQGSGRPLSKIEDLTKPNSRIFSARTAFKRAGLEPKDIGGKIPTNMSGGLIGKGHPIGATGAAQVYSIVEQFRGEAPKGNQLNPTPEYGMTDTLGGDFGTLCHLILGRSKPKGRK